MNKLLYDLFIHIYTFIIRIVSPFNPKAKLWLRGRRNIFDMMKAQVSTSSRVIWMHCSSLGEFEQGRPVLEKLKVASPQYKILVTFFSPSGYEVRKSYEKADYIFYLPMDSRENAKRFLDIVNPQLILFVKYEYWFYYLDEARKRQIPTVLVSGIFRKDQPFFRWYGGLHKKMLSSFAHLFVQNKTSAGLLSTIGFKDKVTVSGDTRFDRVIKIAEDAEEMTIIKTFIQQSKVIVAGSTWSEDDEELDHFANTNPDVKFIVAPHDISSERIRECLKMYKKSILYSSLTSHENVGDANVLVIDNIGMLSRLYRYATICFVGGAFGDDGVHNVIEAAVYGKPVVFGPEYEKYFEAVELVENGGGFSIENALELEKLLQQLLLDKAKYNAAAQTAKDYVYSKQGATDAIVKYVYENRLLIN